MIKVVLDTNIFISSIFWGMGNPHKIIEKAINQKIEIFSSEEILEELQKILKRDFEQPEDLIGEQINFIKQLVEIVEIQEKVDFVKEDIDDNKIIECAVSANANFIITGDNHLLKLKEYHQIKIINVRDFLDIIEEKD